MKTPLQELFQYESDLTNMFDSERRVAGAILEYIRTNKKDMLEKEKEVLIETSKNSYIAGYLDNQAKVDDSMNFTEEITDIIDSENSGHSHQQRLNEIEDYIKTFNTKEK